MDRGSVEEAAYTADAKGLRYMSFSAVVKAAVRHLFNNFYSANATSDAEVEGVATCNGGSSVSPGVEVIESSHPEIGTAGIIPVQEHYRQVAADALRRQNSATTDHVSSPETQDTAVAGECDNSAANPARRRQRELHCGDVQREAASLVPLRSTLSSRRAFRRFRGKANETNCGCETPPEVFAGVISVEKLAMLDAGVYIRPDLSEILASRKDAHEVQAMLKRCRDIDAKIRELKKRAYLRKPSSDMQSQRRELSEGDGTGSTRGDAEEVAEVMSNKVRTAGGVKVSDTTCGKAVCSMPCANVFDNMRRRGELRRPTDEFYAVAASAEIVALRREKLQLHRQLADVRALVEYVWKYRDLSPTSQMNAEQFSRLFCSNEEDLSQQSAAAVLFELCDADNRGRITFEELFTRLPLRALEVMFIVTEMEKKGRQAYRYCWI